MTTAGRISKIQELIYEIRVGDVMTQDVVTVGPSDLMSELRGILREKRISGTPVVEDGRLVGIISIDDFVRWMAQREPDCPIAEKMTKAVETLYTDEPLVRAVNRFDQSGFGRFAVIDRQSGGLRGILTKGDIIEGLLRKLEIHYQEKETQQYRRLHFLEDISADKVGLFFQYEVAGGDFQHAGDSASRLKGSLRRLGLHPELVRRVAIATYEAEMNLVIYAGGGRIRVRVGPKEIFVRVADSGPGIPDVEKAMQPGYSTAPAWVRELGFGAGMGLCNIRKCATKMDLRSTVGVGTQLGIHVSITDGADSAAK